MAGEAGMSDSKLPVINAMDDPAHRAMLDEIVTRMRVALAPMLNAAINDEELFKLTQSMMISAAAMHAGLTVGHMIAVGGMKDQDKRRAGQVMLLAFRNSIEMGKREAREAMLEQMPPQGRA